MSLRSRLLWIALFWIVMTGTRLAAHDMWIEPATFSPAQGEIVAVKLRVGQDLLGDPLPRSTALFKQFSIVDAAGTRPAVGREGGNPAGFVSVQHSGLAVIGYGSNASVVEETAETFNRYLKEEGLETVAQWRAQRNLTTTKVREQFSRCAKSLLLSGPAVANDGDRVLGFTLELLAERNPYTLRAGESFPVRLTYQNRPLAGALVVAMNRQNPSEKITARTGSDGRVRLPLPTRHGMWLIKTVHMVPAAEGSGAEWSSYWASLTFDGDGDSARLAGTHE
jgi:uncharacterized GH25 family protein